MYSLKPFKIATKNKPTKIYRIWKGIIGRCYSEKVQRKNPTYKDVTVCKEWHNFQNFAEWYDENYNPETMQGWQLDKDILFKCNKIYSPETCAFVPKEINILFIKPKHNLPTGVTCRRNKFQVNISKNKIRMFLGAFDTLEEAFQNHTLRPILKIQNDLLVQVFINYAIKQKSVFFTLSPALKRLPFW